MNVFAGKGVDLVFYAETRMKQCRANEAFGKPIGGFVVLRHGLLLKRYMSGGLVGGLRCAGSAMCRSGGMWHGGTVFREAIRTMVFLFCHGAYPLGPPNGGKDAFLAARPLHNRLQYCDYGTCSGFTKLKTDGESNVICR